MQRVLSIWLTNWAIDLHRRRGTPPDARPLLLVALERQRQVVVACCARAKAAGVRPGLPLSDARAVLPPGGADVIEHEPDRHARALRALAAWMQRFSPRVAPDPPAGLMLDVSGCAAVFGGEPALLARAQAELQRLGFASRAAIAPTAGCAWALARFAHSTRAILQPEQIRTVLSPLPLRALRLDPALCAQLADLGIERVGDLSGVPRSAIPSRFGAEPLLRLDQALGQAIEIIEPVRAPATFDAELVFEGPTTDTAAVALAVRRVLDDLARSLASAERGARRLEIELTRAGLPLERLALLMTRPTRDPRALWALAAPKLERVHMGHGVEGVRARATTTARVRHGQTHFTGAGSLEVAARARADLTDALLNRLGPSRVLSAQHVESHVPERSFAWRTMMDDPPATHSTPHPAAPPGEHAALRPATLLDTPCPTEVVAMAPDGPVCTMRWRGAVRHAIACVGPERIGPEWWRGDRDAREYFRVQLDDGWWVWLRRAGGAWTIHGWW